VSAYVEGHCGWADRGKYLLSGGSAVLWQETMCREWYSLLLRPWVHYVPSDYHLHALQSNAAWALCHRDRTGAVAGTAQRFSEAVLTRRAATAFGAALLEGYAAAWNRFSDEPQRQEPNVAAGDDRGCPSEPAGEYLKRTRPFEAVSWANSFFM